MAEGRSSLSDPDTQDSVGEAIDSELHIPFQVTSHLIWIEDADGWFVVLEKAEDDWQDF